MKYTHKSKCRIVTFVTFLFGLILTSVIYDSGASRVYWIITISVTVIVCGVRAILTELSEPAPETNQSMKEQKESITSLPGIALLGLLLTGVAGIFHTFDSGSGVGLIASAISFGVLAVVSFM